jgi:hypothetical protein
MFAARLGTTAGNLSSRLSKLAAYGIISKVRHRWAAIIQGQQAIKHRAINRSRTLSHLIAADLVM